MDISIIIPSFNGGEALRVLTQKINETLSGKYSYELLFIFDDGTKRTWQIIKELRSEYPDYIKAYRLARNYGQHRAILFGFSRALGDFVVTIDEDMQHNPADILKLVKKQKDDNYDIVYGKFTNLQHNRIRKIISAILREVMNHFIPNLYENYSPYRLIRRDIARRSLSTVCTYIFIDDFLSRITQNIAFVNIDHYKRMEGESSYKFIKLVKHGIFILLAYSKIIPLLFSSSLVFIGIGSVLFTLILISPENLDSGLINNRTILATMSIGFFFIILSFVGSYINHRNSQNNSRPIKIIDESSI
jgi:undecaprenyl-phosphate 4-deoxy-4-formamido-L-arabinose transferase